MHFLKLCSSLGNDWFGTRKDVLSADTRGTARDQLEGLPLQLHILTGNDHDAQKRDFAAKLDLRTVVSFGLWSAWRVSEGQRKQSSTFRMCGCDMDKHIQRVYF